MIMIPKKLIKTRRLQRKTKRKEEGNIKDIFDKENNWVT